MLKKKKKRKLNKNKTQVIIDLKANSEQPQKYFQMKSDITKWKNLPIFKFKNR